MDEILTLSGKLRVDAAQWSQGFRQAEAATKQSTASMEASFGKMQRTAQQTVRVMDEASARVAAASWAARRAAEQEAESRRVVAASYRETSAEIKKHRTYEQAAAHQSVKLWEAQGWAARRAATDEVAALRAIEAQAKKTGQELQRAARNVAEFVRQNNAGGGVGGYGRSTIGSWVPPSYLRTRPSGSFGSGAASLIGGVGGMGLGGGMVGSALVRGGPAAAGAAGIGLLVSQAASGEAAMNRLQSVIRATGGQSGRTAAQMAALADQIHRTTSFSKDSALAAQTFLATLDGISGQNFDDAVRAASDLASVMQIDLPSATEMVGKALQEPENGLRALSSAGVKFTDDQKELIKTLLESGDVMGAQRVILDELTHRMGGAAVSAATTLSGRLQQLKNDVGELGQTIGTALVNPLETAENLLGTPGLSGVIAAAVDPEAAKGLAGKFDDPASRADRKRREYLAAKNQESKQAYGIGLTAEQIAAESKAFDALNEEERNRWDYETDAGKNFNFGGETDRRKLQAAAAQGNAYAQRQLSRMESPAEIEARRTRNRTASATEATANAQRQAELRRADPVEQAKRARAFAASRQGREALGRMTSDQGRSMVGEFAASAKTIGGGLTTDMPTGMIDRQSQGNVDALIERYRAMFSAMPQFSEEAWKKIEEDLRFNLTRAAGALDEQKELYLRNAEEAAKSATDMFTAYDHKIEESKKKAEELRLRTVAAIDPSAIPNLRGTTLEEGRGLVGSMGRDVTETLKPDEAGAIDTSQLGTILSNYKLILQQMPGYSEQAFAEIERQVIEHADNAMKATGALRETYLQRMKETLATAGGVSLGGVIQGPVQQAAAAPGQDARAYYNALGAASKNNLQGEVAGRLGNVQQAKAAAASSLGIGTKEQRQGLVELAKLQADVMKKIRDSTGKTREANIEELRKLDEAWAKAFGAIRDGSKETVDQLVGDAVKQTGAYQDAASKRGSKGGGGAGGSQFNSVGEMMAGITQMSQGLSNMFMGALSGVGNAGAAFGAYISSITDPVERIDAQIADARQKLQGAAINAANYGSTAGATTQLEAQVKALEKERAETIKRREAARKEAFRQDREAKRIKEADEASTTFLVGAKASSNLYGPGFRAATANEAATPSRQDLTINFTVNGPVKPDELLQMLDRAAKQAGIDKSGRSFLRAANGRA